MTTAASAAPDTTCGFAVPSDCDASPDLHTAALDDLLALPRDPQAKHPHKDVLCFRDEGQLCRSTIYIKRQWAWDRRVPRWSDWRDGVAGDPDPVREARGLALLHEVGLSVPTPLRLLRDPQPGSPRAALLMSAVPAVRSLADWLSAGDVARLGPLERRALVVAIAGTVGMIHQRGLRWRSMKAKHLYPQLTTGGDWRIWLIDCEGVRPRATRRQRRRDRRLLLRTIAGSSDEAFAEMLEHALQQ